ncbi:MAG: PIG-L family deacetylase [Promicromonosporaceae bacterium]|nr:PIG-L family deacetylase [Promicromonosporaceae bacterium]
MLLHAHPDDETLWTGGLIATAARAGTRVIVVTATRGERGEVLTLPGTASEDLGFLNDDGEALAAYRTLELERALAELGPGVEHHFLDELPAPVELPASVEVRYHDSGMVWLAPGLAGPAPDVEEGFAIVPLEQPARQFAEFVAGLGPGIIVVTYGADGGYGHPDHVRCHEVVVRARELLAAQGANVPEFWEISRPDEGDIQIPMAPVLNQVMAALRMYATQVQGVRLGSREDAAQGVSGWFALSNGEPLPIRAWEWYQA